MSTVLWANVLAEGKVKSDACDHIALYRHAPKLDALTKALGLPSFLDICDTTDQRCNIEGMALPTGMTSTDDLMAVQGSWTPISEAISLLEALRNHITSNRIRFGMLSNQQPQVVAELDEVIAFAKGEMPRADKFNFSVVA